MNTEMDNSITNPATPTVDNLASRPTSSPSNPSGLAAASRKFALAISSVFATLVPSASTTVIVGGGAVAMSTMSCEKEIIDPNAIDRTTDNAKHKAEYMSDVKFVTLGNGEATLKYEGVWVPNTNGKGGNYKLKPIPVINFDQAKIALESDARRLNIPLEKMGFEFFLSINSGFSMGFAIPYSHISSLSGEQIMKFEDFKQFIPPNAVGIPDQLLSKKEVGFLRISTGDFYREDIPNGMRIQREIQTISPYILGN